MEVADENDDDNAVAFAPPAFTPLEVKALMKKPSRSSGNFFWMRVATDEKALIERWRRKLTISGAFDGDANADVDADADAVTSVVGGDGTHDDGMVTDDIPAAQVSSMFFLDEVEVTEKLHELERVRDENVRLEAEVRTHSEALAEVENEVTALTAAVGAHRAREVELDGAVVQLRAEKAELEAALREARAQHEAQRSGAEEALRTAESEWRAAAGAVQNAVAEREAAARAEHAQELLTTRAALDAALQREGVLRARVEDLEALLRNAMAWQEEAKRREEGLREELREACSVHGKPPPLPRKLRPCNTALFDVLFPDQDALGLVIVPHELQCSHVVSGLSGGPITPTKLRPLGDNQIVDCAMVTSSSVATCLQHGDVLLSINGSLLVSQRIDELHGENRGEVHFSAVMDAVAHAARPRRLRFLRLSRDAEIDVAALPAKDVYGQCSSRTVKEKEAVLLFDSDLAATHHVEHYEYTISNSENSPVKVPPHSPRPTTPSFPLSDSFSALVPPLL